MLGLVVFSEIGQGRRKLQVNSGSFFDLLTGKLCAVYGCPSQGHTDIVIDEESLELDSETVLTRRFARRIR